MKNVCLLMALWLIGSSAQARNPYLPPEGMPGSFAETMDACANIPSLANFGRQPIFPEAGYELVLLGSKIPIAPGPHIPWAQPYYKKPRVLIIHLLGVGDTFQVAQLLREFDCDPRFVLAASMPLTTDWEGGIDEAYRLGYLADQARAALREDYDAIIFALGSYSPGYGYPLRRALFPDDVYQTVLDKVRHGTGLVLVGTAFTNEQSVPWVAATPLKAAAPALQTGGFRWLENPAVTFTPASAFRGLPTDLPTMALWEFKPTSSDVQVVAEASGKPLIYTGHYGEGRTVVLTYDGTLAPVASASQLRGDDPHATATPLQFEHGLALAARAVAYAAKAEPRVFVVPAPTTAAAGQPILVKTTLSAPASLECVVRDAVNHVHASAKLKAVPGDQQLSLPALPTGAYWLDIIARDAHGASLGWGSAPLQVTAPQTLTLATDKDVYRVGETVLITGKLAGEVPAARVVVSVTDATGRLLSQGPAPIADSQFRYEYPVKATVTGPHVATAVVSSGAGPLLRTTAKFFAPRRGWDDYEISLWNESWWSEANEHLRDLGGITSFMDSWGRDAASQDGARFGFRTTRMNEGVVSPAEVQLQAPEPQTYGKELVQKGIAVARKFGAFAFCLQDERNQPTDPGLPNPAALVKFRAYLKQQYGTLDKLNAEWDRSFQSWDDVKPLLAGELTPQNKNLAPWLDVRLWVADQCFQIDKAKAQAIKTGVGPEVAVGIDGFTTGGAIPYAGIDIGRLLTEGVFDHYCPYDSDLMIASLLRQKMVKYTGWSEPRADFLGNPWRDLFRGHWGAYRYEGVSFQSGFGWVMPAALWSEEGTREIRNGCGKLLMGSTRQFAPVAILYSYPSMCATAGSGVWVEKGNDHLMLRPVVASRDAIEQMLVKNGITFQYVLDTQLAKNALKGIKLLFLPSYTSIALSDEACAAIKQFVADGGYVVADLMPAALDEHGKLRRQGGLNDLFGIKRPELVYGQRTTDYLVGITENDPWLPTKNAWYVDEWFEKGLQLTDGKACGVHIFDKVPAFIIKNTGKGRALLWNFLNTSTVRRNGEPEADDMFLMSRLLSGSGVTPYLKVPGCEVNVFRDHGAEYIGVYPYTGTSQSVPGDLQLATGAVSAQAAASGKAGVLKFAEPRETYDVRSGTYLGRLKDVPLPGKQNAALIARLAYRVTGLTVKAVKPDRQTVQLSLALQATAAPGRHVIHLEVLEPDGGRNYYYSRNVEFLGGQGRTALHLALNDKPGQWKVIAREVVSGQTATARFTVQ